MAIRQLITIKSSPEKIYRALTSAKEFSEATGAPAEIAGDEGGAFSCFGGQIVGRHIELDPGKRIVQAWRTSNFEDADPDSRLEVILEPAEGGTRVRLRHTNLPAHGSRYETGWVSHYFEPMRRHFGGT